MKLLIFTFVLFFLLFDGIKCKRIEEELIPYGVLPKIKTSLTENDKESIMNGAKAAVQFFKFLVEKDFFSTLTKISAVAGPIFSAISAILTVVFMFIEIESPEMKLMKIEFAQLNNRIDKWSVEFKIIKRKIDWSAVQINFGDIENNIISLHKNLAHLPDVPVESREAQASYFLNKYEINYKASGDLLYKAMMNVEQIYSVNLFRAAQFYMENDRNLVQEFMMDLLKLLTQAIQIEAAYVHLKYDNKEAFDFTQSLWEKKLAVLKEKMEQIDLETKNKYNEQYKIDLDNLLSVHYSESNERFSSIAYNYFTSKYNWREWFVLVYAELSGFKDHTVSTCQGTFKFRTHGRNIILSSVDKSEGNSAMSHIERNKQVIGSYNSWYRDSEYSRGWVNHIRGILPYCGDADTVASVGWGSNVWFYSNRLVLYKKNCVNDNWPCYNTFIFA